MVTRPGSPVYSDHLSPWPVGPCITEYNILYRGYFFSYTVLLLDGPHQPVPQDVHGIGDAHSPATSFTIS